MGHFSFRRPLEQSLLQSIWYEVGIGCGRDTSSSPTGCCSEAGGEGIRTKLMKDGHIDTVIGLPTNLFYSTGIPVCILVPKKCNKPDDVLFIKAAEHFVKGKRQNQRTNEHIGKIIETYQFRKEEDCYSKRVSMERATTSTSLATSALPWARKKSTWVPYRRNWARSKNRS